MQQIAPQAEALYILGDLFEFWAGDDDLDDPLHKQVTQAMRTLTAGGTRLFIMHGNRDLLMGKTLTQAASATLLEDPTLINLYGTPTLLTHGDALCTDDIAYQSFRNQVHDASWQQSFLAQPLAHRKMQITQMRTRSENEKQQKNSAIMDVNAESVADLLREYNYPRLIHGHTHHLMHSLYHQDGHTCERWVLGDWNKTGNTLRCDILGCQVDIFDKSV